MVRIGHIELGEFPLLLAPMMEDVNDPPFRVFCKAGCRYDVHGIHFDRASSATPKKPGNWSSSKKKGHWASRYSVPISGDDRMCGDHPGG